MKNVLSTLALLAILILIGIGGWYIYATSFLPEGPPLPLNARKAIPGMLSSEKQIEIWENEHAAIQIEHYVGEQFIPGWVGGDLERLMALFSSEFNAFIPTDSEWVTKSKPPFEEVIRITGEQEGLTQTEVEFFDLIFAKTGGLRVYDSEFRVLSIERLGQYQWGCRIRITISGIEDGSGKYMLYQNEADVGISQSLENDFSTAMIEYWNTRAESFRTCTADLMFKEQTDTFALDKIQLHDNWKQLVGARIPHRFQMAVEDFDLDGDHDVAILSADGSPMVLGFDNGRFEDVTESLGISVAESESAQADCELPGPVAWIDFDNDSYPDLVLGHRVYKNESGKSFRQVTAESGLKLEMGVTGLTVVDYNNDGFLDLYATRKQKAAQPSWIDQSGSGATNQLFKNNGDGSFSDVTESSNAGGGTGHSNAAVWFFHDDDHYPDLYIANEFGKNTLLDNQAGSKFTDMTNESGVGQYAMSRGVAAGDLNNDGAADIFVSNTFSTTGERMCKYISKSDFEDDVYSQVRGMTIGNQIYEQKSADGKLNYENRAAESGAMDSGWSWGPIIFDVDSDGLLDLYTTSGYMSFDRDKPDAVSSLWKSIATQPNDRTIALPAIGELNPEAGEFWENPIDLDAVNVNLGSFQKNRLFLNTKEQGFLDASFASSASIDSDSRSAIAADFDGDGAVDILVGSVGGGSLRLFTNQMPQGNRLEIRLKGTKSNSAGIGARVTAEFTTDDGKQTIVREMFPQNGFMGTGPANVWIGIGQAEKIDSLSVRWPTGETQVFVDVPVNQSVRVEEGDSEIETLNSF